jgi:hypothetical protein
LSRHPAEAWNYTWGAGRKLEKTEKKQLKIPIFFAISAAAVIKSKYR